MKYRKKWGLVTLSAGFAILFCAVQGWAHGDIQTFARDTSWSHSYSRGMALFKDNCAGCHGENGEGGVSEDAFGPPLNLQSFLTIASKDFIVKSIMVGRETKSMPGLADELSMDDIDAIATYVKGWQYQPSKAVGNDVVVGDPFEGAKWYKGICAGCHGRNGEGGLIDTGGGHLLNSFAAFSPPALADPGFKKSATDGFIKATLMYGRVGTPMASYLKGNQGTAELAEKDINDIVAYIRSMPAVE